MKNISTLLLCTCMSFLSLSSFSQNNDVPPVNEPDYNKPKLFASYPDRIPVDLATISQFFAASTGAAIDVNIDAGSSFRIAGSVVSVVSKYDNRIRSVVIRSSNFTGATFSISRILLDDGSIKYTGRLISRQYGDVYELQNISNHFVLVKRAYYDIVNE
ncbi:MAG: hypothetical protein JNM88_05800 [Chitinophagaceae bacterium]|nr:hypothetical protein [Chitinophagaceae bacterium]